MQQFAPVTVEKQGICRSHIHNGGGGNRYWGLVKGAGGAQGW